MTVGELMEILECYDVETEVRLATQKHWPFEYSISDVVGAFCDSEEEGGGDYVVYISEGTQLDYLSTNAKDALGW